MFKKLLIILFFIIVLFALWSVFQSYRASSTSGGGIQLFGTNFFSAVSRHVTSGLSSRDTTSPPYVSIEELGEFSPVAGMVEIVKSDNSLTTTDLDYEYIEIRARSSNAQPINISEWSVQSMISNTWIGIPQGTGLYVVGEVNELQDIYLRPGDRAIIATRQSPVGVSFRVNRCSGFLSDTQSFEPPISTSCVAPSDILPPTIENLKKYDDICVRFAENFGKCSYVTSDVTGFENLSKVCREYIQPRLTYNFCSTTHANDIDFFANNEWRIFLNQDETLWRESYEVIRLLDEHNRTVDVFTY